MSINKLFKTVSIFVFLVLSVQLFPQNLAVSLIPEQLKKDVNSVLRYDNTTIEISKSYDMTITREWAVTVLNSSGNEHIFAGSGYSKSLKINEMTARILDANGKEIKKLKSSDIIDVSAVMSGSIFVDDRIQYFKYGPGGYPYTFVFKLVTKNKNTAFLPDWNPLAHEFQSVESSKFKLIFPDNWKLTTNEKNLESFGVTKSTEPGKYSLEISNVLPLTKEYGSPPYYEIKPFASVSANYFQLENIKGQASNWSE
ncbi:MAG: DUF3857 domain-containing protein, partial [Bacteroidales bacterium]|nr:DUF3857 domain-containing protein [Bacteroidales bacterium]